MIVEKEPHYSISSEELAKWLETQPDSWWMVGLDPRLAGDVDFPCPSGELADAVRKINKPLFVFDKQGDPKAVGQEITMDRLNDLADTDNNYKHRTFLLRWQDSDIEWLLSEDEPLI
jgi:hypothetical protein